MTARAWYLGHSRADVGDRVVLVGDPDRVDRLAPLLEDARHLPVKRGLRTVTGAHRGARVTVAAFGMGAPIATIVLHELAALGARRFVRVGTAMHFPPARPGELLVSDGAWAFDGTSPAYGPASGPAYGGASPVPADPGLSEALARAGAVRGAAVRRGDFATFDAFYRDMFGIDPQGHASAAARRREMTRLGVLASDMETAALLSAARALGVACATLCLGTVDALTQEKLAPEAVARGEAVLFAAALEALATEDEP